MKGARPLCCYGFFSLNVGWYLKLTAILVNDHLDNSDVIYEFKVRLWFLKTQEQTYLTSVIYQTSGEVYIRAVGLQFLRRAW